MHCFQEQIQKAAQGPLRNLCLLIHWTKGSRCSFISRVHSKSLSKPHGNSMLPLVWLAVASNQNFALHCMMLMSFSFLDQNAGTLLVGREFLCEYLMTEKVDFSFNS